jgi:hypothetical protein
MALIIVIVVVMSGLAATAAPGKWNWYRRPRKTPGLALVAVTALSSLSYAGYRHLKAKKDK